MQTKHSPEDSQKAGRCHPLRRPWLAVFWRDTAKPLLTLILITCALRSSLADWNQVPTGSMKPTILEGDRIWVNKLAYDLKIPFTTWRLAQWDNPKRGDIVVCFSPADEKRLVKRVIGLPGDTIEMRSNQLIVNGEPLRYKTAAWSMSTDSPPLASSPITATEILGDHPHAVMSLPEKPARRSFGPLQVPTGQYFLIGDNRDNSFDSRYFGPVARYRIVGRATDVVLSFDPEHHYWPRWKRFFTSLI
jgi:signal peptidase I